MESMRTILEFSSHQCPQRSQANVRLQKIESFLPLGVGNTFMEWNRNIMKFLPSKEVKLVDYFKWFRRGVGEGAYYSNWWNQVVLHVYSFKMSFKHFQSSSFYFKRTSNVSWNSVPWKDRFITCWRNTRVQVIWYESNEFRHTFITCRSIY